MKICRLSVVSGKGKVSKKGVEMKKVIVSGATGNLDPSVVPTLLEDSQLSVTIFSRSWKGAHEQLNDQWVKRGGACQEVAM
jgi:hypothetical protein